MGIHALLLHSQYRSNKITVSKVRYSLSKHSRFGDAPNLPRAKRVACNWSNSIGIDPSQFLWFFN